VQTATPAEKKLVFLDMDAKGRRIFNDEIRLKTQQKRETIRAAKGNQITVVQRNRAAWASSSSGELLNALAPNGISTAPPLTSFSPATVTSLPIKKPLLTRVLGAFPFHCQVALMVCTSKP
jgi:hypothetical protein